MPIAKAFNVRQCKSIEVAVAVVVETVLLLNAMEEMLKQALGGKYWYENKNK